MSPLEYCLVQFNLHFILHASTAVNTRWTKKIFALVCEKSFHLWIILLCHYEIRIESETCVMRSPRRSMMKISTVQIEYVHICIICHMINDLILLVIRNIWAILSTVCECSNFLNANVRIYVRWIQRVDCLIWIKVIKSLKVFFMDLHVVHVCWCLNVRYLHLVWDSVRDLR